MTYDIMFIFCYLGVFSLALYHKKGRLLSFLFLISILVHFIFTEFLLAPLGQAYPIYYYVSISLINMMLFMHVLVLERRLSYRIPILLMIIIPYLRAIDIHFNYFGYTITYYLYTLAVPLLNGWLVYNLLRNTEDDQPRGRTERVINSSRSANINVNPTSMGRIFRR